MRKFPVMFAAGAVALLAACGDSGETSATTTAAAGGNATTTTAAAGGNVTTTTAAAGGNATTTTAAATTGAVPVTINERSLDAATSLKAGAVTFAIKNGVSDNQHEFVVMKGKFADLTKTSNGAVDETKLAAGALIGRTAKINGGGSTTATYTLTAGNYVLLCNINSGPNAHAAQGQRLDVTVA